MVNYMNMEKIYSTNDKIKHISSVRFHPESDLVAIGTSKYENNVILLDIKTKQIKNELSVISLLEDYADHPSCVCFSHEGSLIAAGSYAGTCFLWDTNTSELLKIFDLENFKGGQSKITEVIFSPNEDLIGVSTGTKCEFFNLKTYKKIQELKSSNELYFLNDFSPDGTLCSIGGSKEQTNSNFFGLYNIKTGKIIMKFPLFNCVMPNSCFSPDGNFLAISVSDVAIGSTDNNVILYDITNEKIKKRISGFSRFTRDVRFSPDGNFLAIPTGNDCVLYNIKKDEKSVISFYPITNADFSSDGNYLILGSYDGDVYLSKLESLIETPIVTSFSENNIFNIKCPFCNNIFEFSEDNLDSMITCNCGKNLKVNPFTLTKEKTKKEKKGFLSNLLSKR